MSFVGDFFELEGWIAVEMDGNGRRPREVGNDGFRRGIIRFAPAESRAPVARGEETAGIVIEARVKESKLSEVLVTRISEAYPL